MTLARTVARGPRLALSIFVGLASAGPPIYGSVRHNWVLAQGDTRADLEAIMRQLDHPASEVSVYTGRYTRRPLRSCGRRWAKLDASSYSFPRKDPIHHGPLHRYDLCIFDSFSHDRLLAAAPLNHAHPEFDHAFLIQLSPFKEFQPPGHTSADSIYSPAPPDLFRRTKAGPLIEVYGKSEDLCGALTSACARIHIPYRLTPWAEGHYAALLAHGADHQPAP